MDGPLLIALDSGTSMVKAVASTADGDSAAAAGRPGAVLYHPFISSAGERGPFTDSFARASLIGLDQDAGLQELARGIYEGMALAARDCYAALGGAPAETGAAGAAITAAVSIGLCPDMQACAARWTVARHEAPEHPQPKLARTYEALYPIYRDSYAAMPGLWRRLEAAREERRAA